MLQALGLAPPLSKAYRWGAEPRSCGWKALGKHRGGSEGAADEHDDVVCFTNWCCCRYRGTSALVPIMVMVSNSVPCIRELKTLSAEAESSSLWVCDILVSYFDLMMIVRCCRVEMGHDNIWYSRPRKFGAGSRKCKACSNGWVLTFQILILHSNLQAWLD